MVDFVGFVGKFRFDGTFIEVLEPVFIRHSSRFFYQSFLDAFQIAGTRNLSQMIPASRKDTKWRFDEIFKIDDKPQTSPTARITSVESKFNISHCESVCHAAEDHFRTGESWRLRTLHGNRRKDRPSAY